MIRVLLSVVVLVSCASLAYAQSVPPATVVAFEQGADGINRLKSWKPKQPLPFGDEESAEAIEQLACTGFLPPGVNESDPAVQAAIMRAAIDGAASRSKYRTDIEKEVDYWREGLKAAKARQKEAAAKAKKSAKKTAGKSAAVDARSPFMTVGLFSNLLGRSRSSSACANGQCGAQSKAPAAVKPMPIPTKPLPSATKPVRPVAPKPLTDAQKRAAFYQAVREGRYGEILVGNDFTPGGSDFDGPVDYIPVAPKPTPKVVK